MENHEKDIEVNLHIAEYTALTSRCTNFMVINFMLSGIWVTFLAVIAGTWNHSHALVVTWGFMAGTQICFIIMAAIQFEQHLATLYLETNLKVEVKSLILKKSKIWDYETFLEKTRGRKTSFLKDWAGVIFDIMIFAGALYLRMSNWTIKDWAGLGCTIFLGFIFFLVLHSSVNIKQKFESFVRVP